MNSFKEIFAWQKGYKLTLLIYKHTRHFPRDEEFGLKSELRRASVSVISNIAEGFRKYSIKEALHFYNRSQCSIEEIKCQSILALDLNYWNCEEYNEITQITDECARTLNGWIESQKAILKKQKSKKMNLANS